MTSMTGVTGRISQRMAHGTRADGAPYKSISAVTSEATCFHTDVESLTIELEQTIFKAQGIKYITFVLDSGCSSTLCGTDVHSLAASNPEHVNAHIAETHMQIAADAARMKERFMRGYEDQEEAFALLADQIVYQTRNTDKPDFDVSLLDKATGRLTAPKSIGDAQKRSDWLDWKLAVEKEIKSIDDLGVISKGHTLADLKAMGFHKRPLNLLGVWDAKYSARGDFAKRKFRLCAAGHPGNLQRGVD